MARSDLYQHQRECLARMYASNAFAVFAEMGTGKSRIMLEEAFSYHERGLLDAVLIFAPNGVHYNWVLSELPKMGLPAKAYAWEGKVNSYEKWRREADKGLVIFAMNWESLQTDRGFNVALGFLKAHDKNMIICDESDNIKNPKTSRFKALMELRPYSHFRRILSGTPINNSPFDLWSQFQFLNPEILNCPSYTAFKVRHSFIKDANDPQVQWIMNRNRLPYVPKLPEKDSEGRVIYRNIPDLKRRIKDHHFRILKKDCLDLPEKIYETIYFDLSREQRKIYDNARGSYRLPYEAKEIPFDQLAMISKLSQITSGFYMVPQSELPIGIVGSEPKLEILKERVLQILSQGEKIIIWARYSLEIAGIAAALEALAIPYVEYHGSISPLERYKAIEDFNHGPAVVFVGNPQAGGTGITLTAASHVIYYSNSYSARERLQSEDRAHRIGQIRNVTYLDIIARDTINEDVVRILTNKIQIAKEVIDG